MPLIDGGSEVSLAKWKGVFATALKKVAKEVHPELGIENEAVDYVENLIIELLGHLCVLHPHSHKDVEERVKKTFPRPIDQWCVEEGQQAVGKGKKRNPLVLPVDKIHPQLQKEILGYKVDYQVSLYIVAVLEYISADILKLAGNYVRNIRDTVITEQHIKVALCADKVLLEMFQSGEFETSTEDEPVEERPITHQDIVKEMMISERHYVRNLNIIIRVFRPAFVDAKDLFSEEDVQSIFTNIVEVYEFTVMFTGLLENAIEMAEQDPNIVAPIGECFEDMAEAQAFDVYETYLNGQISPANKLYRKLGIGGKLAELLATPVVAQYFESKGRFFKDAVRYVLPRLLAEPISHCLHYFDLIETLSKTTPSEEERRSLKEALSVLQGLQRILEGRPSTGTLGRPKKDEKVAKNQRLISFTSKRPLCKLRDLQRNIEGWEGKDISQSSSELIKDGTLSKISKNQRVTIMITVQAPDPFFPKSAILCHDKARYTLTRNQHLTMITERRVFLLDNLLIFCKQNSRYSSSGPFPEYRFKEKVFLRKAELIDVEDTSDNAWGEETSTTQNPCSSAAIPVDLCDKERKETKNVIEIIDRDGPHIMIKFKNDEEKEEWMSSIMNIYLKRLVEKALAETTLLSSITSYQTGCRYFSEENFESCMEYDHSKRVVAIIRTFQMRILEPVVHLCMYSAFTSELKKAFVEILVKNSTLDRILDNILRESEQATPLRLPTVYEYCFAIEDRDDNIVFEEKQNSGGIAVIKGGTLVKLIERLTYHKYSDPSFLKTFLTTYRSFCKPHDLLDMLVTRYNIPEPPPTEHDRAKIERGELIVREDLKRFRKEYSQPIALRVLNVIRHWVENHFYDFERHPELLTKLKNMLENVNGRAVRKWVESINRIIERKQEDSERPRELTFEKDPPIIEWHLTADPEKFDILTLHPIEIARQLTIIESELYRAVKPSELVGSVWTKDDLKHSTSPNLLKLISHSNKITYWFMKSVLEMMNFEERVAVLSRIIDILMVFQDLNNFSGVMQVVSCLESAAINRLQHTFAELSEKRKAAVEAAKELSADHHKKYVEKLRSINPPCVPFFGMYLTNILKIEDGNPDFLPNSPDGIINFSKRRKVAEITGEIQQYQNQPYCLRTEKSICDYLGNLDPMENLSEKMLEDYFYNSSLAIEPRNCKQVPRFNRKTEINLKSPGIKPTSQRNSTIGMGTLRKGSQLSMITISEKEEIVASPTTPTETTSPIQSPTYSNPERNSWPMSSDPQESDDPFESKTDKAPQVPPRKMRSCSEKYDSQPDKVVVRRLQSEAIISNHEDTNIAPPRPPKSPHKLSKSSTFSYLPICVDLTESIVPPTGKHGNVRGETPPPLPPRSSSTSSLSPLRSPKTTEGATIDVGIIEESPPPALPPRRTPKPR